MKTSLNLSPSILKKFQLTQEPFAIINSRIYTLGRESDRIDGIYWEYLNRKYPLFESDSLIEFQNETLSENQKEITEYMSWVIYFKLIRKLENLANHVSNRMDYYFKLKQHSLDKFLLDIFDIFNHKRDKKEKTTNKDITIDTTIDSYPPEDDIKNIGCPVYKVISRPGVLSIGEQCYRLVSVNAYPDCNGIVYFNGKKYHLQPTTSLEELVKEIDIQIKGEIELVALSHGNKFRDQIRRLSQEKDTVESKIQTKANSNIRRAGNIGYEPLGGNKYLIYAEIEPFILEKDGGYYAFNEKGKSGSKKVQVGTILTIDSKNLIIECPPIVLNMPYFHPFVYDSAKICYRDNDKDNNRWKYLQIKFSHTYSLGSSGLATKVAQLFWEANTSITQGYLGNKVEPVHFISKFNPIATNLKDARAYARQHGISELQIFNN